MMKVDIEKAASLAKVVSGTLDRDKLTLFAPMRNEIRLLPAWLAHHRSIGFEQFLIWDDASDDGTLEFLQSNPDCIVMASALRYNRQVRYTDPAGKTSVQRLGTVFKAALPHVLLQDAFVGYLDADEFLILPPGVKSVRDIAERLENEGSSSVVATVVEFFPAAISELQKAMPASFTALVAAYPFIQSEKLIELAAGKTSPQPCNPSKSGKLFQKYDVSFRSSGGLLKGFWHFFKSSPARDTQSSPLFKTPLIRRNAASFQVGSHKSSLSPTPTTLLTVAHFVFTAQSYAKAERAINEKAHANKSRKYHGYVELFDKMNASSGSFLDDFSVRYEGAEQLIRLGLMRW